MGKQPSNLKKKDIAGPQGVKKKIDNLFWIWYSIKLEDISL